VILAVACGCGPTGAVATSNQEYLEQFRTKLQGLEQSIGNRQTFENAEEFSEDLIGRMDQLIVIASELEFATTNDTQAAEVAKSISATLNEMYNATEADPDVEKLRTEIQKVKDQSESLSRMLR
jgi:hypothetical protein